MSSNLHRHSVYLRTEEFAEVDRIARERTMRWGRALRLLIRSHPETNLSPNFLDTNVEPS